MHLGQVRECTKLDLDRRSRSVFNAEMPTRIPRALKKKRTELTGQRHNLIKEIQKIDREIRAIDHAIKLIAPGWIPSPGTSRSFRARAFRKGTITKACLEIIVHMKGEYETRDLARRAAKLCKAKFESKTAEESFYSAVAVAARRLEKIGALEECGQTKGTRAIMWRTRLDSRGWLGPLKAAA